MENIQSLAKQINSLNNKEFKILLSLTKYKDLQSIKNLDSNIIEKLKWENEVYCSWCKSNNIKKNGLYKEVQRYRCKNCLRTFNYKTNTFMSRSRLSVEQWINFIKCFILHMTCKSTKKFVKISIWSIWKNRIKILKSIFNKFSNEKLNGFIWIDETFVNETYKGNWLDINKHFRLIYKQEFEQKNKTKLRGLSRFKLNIMTGINEQKEMFLDIPCYGKLSVYGAERVLKDNLGNVEYMITDMEKGYFNYSSKYNVDHEEYKASIVTNRNKLSPVNRLHSKLKDFLRPFKGVSFIYIFLYLIWFKFVEKFIHFNEHQVLKEMLN